MSEHAPRPSPAYGKQLWVILAEPVGDGSLQQTHFTAHLQHQADLEAQGIMFGAGPMTETGTQKRTSLIIIRAADEAEAKRIAESDPMHVHGARTYRLFQWSMNEGALTVKINLATRSFEFD